jgi:tetratricopeptide (TPR) repeat protein
LERARGEGAWLTASALLRPPREEGGLYYAQTWALAHMLNLAPEYRDAMPRYIASLAQGTGEAEAFRTAFGKSLEQAVSDLPAYLRALRATTIDAPVAATDPPQEQKLTGLEDLLLRANLALETGRLETARPLIEQAARENATHPATAAALGSLAFAQGDHEQARSFFERAVELDPRDASAWFQLALIERTRTSGADRFQEWMERAVALNPNLGEAHLLLGVRATDAGALAPAIGHLRQAARLLPRQSHVWHALAFALQKQGAMEEAREAARRAVRTAATPEQAGMAEALLRSLL